MADKISKRASLLWTRLTQWYGSRLAEQFGPTPTEDWCAIVDATSDEVMRLALSEIRTKHPTYPPTLPEFDALVAKCKVPTQTSYGATIQEQLCDFVLRNRAMTWTQTRMPWKYIGRTFEGRNLKGEMVAHHGVEIVGVIVPADGDHPGYRVMIADMQLQERAA